MRSALSDLVTNLETDTSTRICSFSVNLDELDIGNKLNTLAKTNSHIAGWSLVKQQPVETTSTDEVSGESSEDASRESSLPSEDLDADFS